MLASLLLYFFILFIVFYAICVYCDEYLVPCVEVFIKSYQIPEEVAGEY